MKPLSYNPRDPWAVLNDRGDEEVCRVIGGDTNAECHAYARLFVAAPELLAACKEARFHTLFKAGQHGVDKLFAMLDAAISKAEGATTEDKSHD